MMNIFVAAYNGIMALYKFRIIIIIINDEKLTNMFDYFDTFKRQYNIKMCL